MNPQEESYEEEHPTKKPVQESEGFSWIIPDCCKEGWKSCPHVLGKQKKIKQNVGL